MKIKELKGIKREFEKRYLGGFMCHQCMGDDSRGGIDGVLDFISKAITEAEERGREKGYWERKKEELTWGWMPIAKREDEIKNNHCSNPEPHLLGSLPCCAGLKIVTQAVKENKEKKLAEE